MKRYEVIQKSTGEGHGTFDSLRESKQWIRMGDKDTWDDFYTYDHKEQRRIDLNEW